MLHLELDLKIEKHSGFVHASLSRIFMNTSAAIADPLYDKPSAGGLAPRTLTVLHEYASGPQGSVRRSRNAAQRFRHEPS